MNYTAPPSAPGRHTKVILFCLIAVCLGPLLFAWTIYRNADSFDIKTKHSGELLQPIVATSHLDYATLGGQMLPASTLAGKWWLIYTPGKVCETECHERIAQIGQLHIALGKHQDQVKKMYLADRTQDIPAWLAPSFSDVELVTLDPAQRLHYFMSYAAPSAVHSGAVFIMDPQLNVMMHYSDAVPAEGILSDIKRLLKVGGAH